MIDYKTTRLGSPRTMIGYAVVIRLLPVTLVLASMAAATVIGLRFIRALRMGTSRYRSYRTGTKHGEGYKKFVDEEDGGVELGGAATAAGDDNGVLDEEQGKQGGIAGDDVGLSEAGTGLDQEDSSQSFLREGRSSHLRTVEIEDILSDNPEIFVGPARDYEHDVRVGRPNIEALVRAAVAGMRQEPSPTTGQRRLVVAACGPSEMVKTTREAVADCRRSYEHCRRVRIEFSGAEWRW